MRLAIPAVRSMLRISEECLEGSTVVHVAGRLVGKNVEELDRVCASKGKELSIELSGLMEADEVGLSLLRSLRDAGAVLTGVSPFMSLLLETRVPHGPG